MTMSHSSEPKVPLYELWFYRKKDYDNDNERLLGIFSTMELAKAAKEALSRAPGFRNYPDAFHIAEDDLNETSWQTGFVTWDEA